MLAILPRLLSTAAVFLEMAGGIFLLRWSLRSRKESILLRMLIGVAGLFAFLVGLVALILGYS